MKVSIAIKPLALMLCAISLTACATPSQMYWDHKVKELCEKDGGVTVYEHIQLTKAEYDRNDGKNGIIEVMSEDTSLSKHEYAWRSITTEINHSNPEVRRTEYITYRKSDKKELGKWITYSRRGGDIPNGISADSHFGCKDVPGFQSNAIEQIFSIKGE